MILTDGSPNFGKHFQQPEDVIECKLTFENLDLWRLCPHKYDMAESQLVSIDAVLYQRGQVE